MRLIVSEGWPKERLLKLVRALYNTIDHLEYNWCDGGEAIVQIEFISDLCLSSFGETFTEVGDWNEIPAQFTAEVDFEANTIKVL